MSKDDVLTVKNGQIYLIKKIHGRGLRLPVSEITLSTKDILTYSLCMAICSTLKELGR